MRMDNRIRAVVSAMAVATACTAASPVRAGLDEPIYVVDSPTAGLLAHGEYHIRGRVGPESSFLLSVRLGLRDIAQIGVSFGMQRLFERADVSVNDQVGFQARVRLIPETTAPALAIGFDSQGVGRFDEDADRYERKSKGFYVVASKNWKLFVGQFSLHGGINYSLEGHEDNNADAFAAGEFEIVHGLALVMDADAAINDDGGYPYGEGGIYLDGGVRINHRGNLSIMVLFRDLTGNYAPDSRVAREFEIAFVGLF